jgi:hypothetical protein
MSMKNSNDTIWDRTSDFLICSYFEVGSKYFPEEAGETSRNLNQNSSKGFETITYQKQRFNNECYVMVFVSQRTVFGLKAMAE